MKRLALVLPFLVACITEEEDLSEVESAGTSYQGTSYQGTSYQGTSYQGTSYQGTSYQGTSYQGTSYQGTSYQGTSYQGASLGTAVLTGEVSKTTLETWRQIRNGYWEQRLPDRICTYNADKTTASCSAVNLATAPSPLAGVTFQATFVDPSTGLTRQGTLRIGSGTGDVGAVSKDTSYAMHPLNGAGVPGTPQYVFGCTHPNGCRQNSDLWLYDIELVDTNGTATNFCNGAEKAFALAGTWDLTGKRASTLIKKAAKFTFACTNGTIAKCTRWGYRPFGSATKTNGQTVAMADYHQACLRAATADYCANGTSFTKDGTLIDIYDYQPHQPYDGGFIPRTYSLRFRDADPPTAFAWESTFDKHGGTELDFQRYSDLGSLHGACPNKFSLGTAPVPGAYHMPASRGPASFEAPYVSVDTTTTCSHDETTLGRALHPTCSKCTHKLWVQLGTISCIHTGPWDESCRKLALDRCTPAERMAKHSECTAGPALSLYDSACTIEVCGDPQYQSCCTAGWTSACVARANARCKGGRERTTVIQYGFCDSVIAPVLSLQQL